MSEARPAATRAVTEAHRGASFLAAVDRWIDRLSATPRWVDPLVLLALVVLMARGWFEQGFPAGSDSEANAAQVMSILEHPFSLPWGIRWDPTWYLGYPVFTSIPPVPNAISAAFVSVFGLATGLKVAYGVLYWGTSIAMYLWVLSLTGSRIGALTAAAFYVFNPLAITIFVAEGHMDVLLACAVAPLLFLTMDLVFDRPSARLIALGALLAAVLTLSHPQAMPLLFGPYWLAYIAFRGWRALATGARPAEGWLRPALYGLAMFIAGMGLSAFYWLPLLEERSWIYGISFQPEDARVFSARATEVLSLRPVSPNNRLGFDEGWPTWQRMVVLLPALLAIWAFTLSSRKPFAWFLFLTMAFAALLAMGSNAPLRLLDTVRDLFPFFFSSVRAPLRFLVYVAMSLAALTGILVAGRGKVGAPVLGIGITVVLLATVWGGARDSFRSFQLPAEWQVAGDWLRDQPSSTRVTAPPFRPWRPTITGAGQGISEGDLEAALTYPWEPAPGSGNVVNPITWTTWHGRRSVEGGVPSYAPLWMGQTLELLRLSGEFGPTDYRPWLRVLAADYVLEDASDPQMQFARVRDPAASPVWSEGALRLYAVEGRMADAYVLREEGRTDVPLAVLTQSGPLSASPAPQGVTLNYDLRPPQEFRAAVEFPLGDVRLTPNSWVRFEIDSNRRAENMYVELDVITLGTRYGFAMLAADGIHRGRNVIDFPGALLLAREAPESGRTLFEEEPFSLQLALTERNQSSDNRGTITVRSLAVVERTVDDVPHRILDNGRRYEVDLSGHDGGTLVRASAYYPRWQARLGDAELKPRPIYESLLAFDLPSDPGSDTTLEASYRVSGLRRSGEAITVLTAIVLLALVVWPNARKVTRGLRLRKI